MGRERYPDFTQHFGYVKAIMCTVWIYKEGIRATGEVLLCAAAHVLRFEQAAEVSAATILGRTWVPC